MSSLHRYFTLWFLLSPDTLFLAAFWLIGGMGLLLLDLFDFAALRLLSHQPSSRHKRDFSLLISNRSPVQSFYSLPEIHNSKPAAGRRNSRKIRHHQFGIYRRLRWKYKLFPGYYGNVSILKLKKEEAKRLYQFQRELNAYMKWMDCWMSGSEHTTSKLHHVPHGTWNLKVKNKYGVPTPKVDNLLNQVDVQATFRAEHLMRHCFSFAPISNKLEKAFIAAADLLKELHYERSYSPIAYEGAYLVDDSHRSDVPVVFDTGCSFSVTPFIENFVSELEHTDVSELTGLTDTAKIHGVGWVEWPIRDVFGQVAVIRTQAYHVPDATIRLNSPQTYFQEHGAGSCTFNHTQLTLTTALGNDLQFPYHPSSNLPLMFLDRNVSQAGLTGHQVLTLSTDPELHDKMKSLLHQENYNLTQPQKELLLWHYRLCHAGLGWVQTLMLKPKHEINSSAGPSVLRARDKATPRCPRPKCAACQLGKQFRTTPNSVTVHANPDREMAIKRGDIKPGDCVSMDQYVCKVPG